MLNTVKRIRVLGAVFVSVGALAAPQSTNMPALFPQVQTFGMVGLAQGQTARLNLLNPGVLAPFATGAICSAQVSFLDSTGAVLKTAPISVLPGQSVPFDYTDVTATGQRVQIRATLQVPLPSTMVASAPPQMLGCPLIPTLEIFDNDTGRTQVVITETRGVLGPILLPVPVAPVPNP